MKIFCSCIFLLLLLQGCGDNKKDLVTATTSEEKLREDFLLLKKIVTAAHAGAYAYNTPAQLNALFDSVYKTIDHPLTTREFFNKVDGVIDWLRCIHSRTTLPDEYYDSISNKTMFFPIPLLVINNRLYINTNNWTFLKPGSEVIAINDKPATELIAEMGRYTHTDGYSDNIKHDAVNDEFGLNYYLAYGGFKKFSLRYSEPGESKYKSINVDARKLKKINNDMYNDTWYFYPGDAMYDFEILDDKHTAILTIRSFSYDTYSLSTAFSHFIDNSFRMIFQNDIRNLVIDCRNNGGGQYASTYPVLSYLVNHQLAEYDSAIKRYDKLPYPEYVAEEDTARLSEEDSSRKGYVKLRPGVYAENKDSITVWDPVDKVFKGKLFVITNDHVISAASNFAAILKDQTDAFLIGDETGGNHNAHNSYVFTYELPNSHLKVNIPTRRYYQPVPAFQVGRGVIPHKLMPLTVEDVIDNRDGPLAYILDSMIRN